MSEEKIDVKLKDWCLVLSQTIDPRIVASLE
jgi:hypothetical protein